MELSAVAARDQAKLKRTLAEFRVPPMVLPVGQLGGHADIVIECAPKAVFKEIANTATVEVWADPAVNRNMHTIKVEADASNFTMILSMYRV